MLTAKARRELKTLSKFHKESIISFFEELKEDPFIGKPLTRNLIRRFSIRVGVYRIIYKINREDKIVTIISSGHRSIVYQ